MTQLDGVLAITTYTIDEFLELTGPIAVPEYDATIASGETTLKALELTRVARPGENRKAFLSAFADRLFDNLLGLPPERLGRGRRPGQHIPEPAPAAGLVPGSCRPGARRPQRLRWRRSTGPG